MKTIDISNDDLQLFYSIISDNIIRLRNEKGISQLNLATSIGHTSSTFLGKAELLADGKHFNLEHLYKIAIALNVDIKELFVNIETKDINKS
ncbi:transcriptional regulator [Malaciobacter molluscorum]|uniref:helix-turn-helix domain-containing protein n=1 Tax=Malaciobacter molluscorum TaxID=1032072 RepID=UPI00100AA6A6|nr:helix-turn-helix transcriptional regulator [Malaciobacter molluscorum]RXJ93771.1 transcriptional regulator [Malaciobacter molluscorum]